MHLGQVPALGTGPGGAFPLPGGLPRRMCRKPNKYHQKCTSPRAHWACWDPQPPVPQNWFRSFLSNSFRPARFPSLPTRRTRGSADSRGLRPLPPTPRKRWSLHVPGDAQEARLNFGLRDRQLDPPRISCSFPEGTRGSFPYEFQLETPDPHRCLCVHLSFKRGRPFRGPKLMSKRCQSASLETENPRWETMGEPAGAQEEK